MSEDIINKILEKCVPNKNGCIEWKGRRFGLSKYPAYYDSKNRKEKRGHRYLWELHHGEIPPGLVVMHMCDNPSCLNIDHLKVGTQAQNLRDAWIRGRKKLKTHCLRGHELTEENVNFNKGYRNCKTCQRIKQRQKLGSKPINKYIHEVNK